ncbi:polysaccharide pyruvyl transferase family protein [Nocardia huaxiensis]|uniref:Polysaccharide pyruvyl transferase family protein n=1 Tax=Nocardia huaxiensis TaxID=2755382 RepID=A0A7D6V9S5_9NOCA|nr:polysaccharide pyruvyl transferase family protein [Nocardia huaxiensis]QLY27717.1 polysaccharide pyruvyl transferase family protein [Nocardia huaxiensis]
MEAGLPCGGAGHRILIENSEYWLRNYGDLAMLDVTVRRLRERWPHARIGIMTESPALVAAYYPDAIGITVHDTDPWGRRRLAHPVFAALGPAVVGPPVLAWLRSRAWLRRQGIRAKDVVKKRLGRAAPEGAGAAVAAAASDTAAQTLGTAAETSGATSHASSTAQRVEADRPGAARAAREASLVLALGGGYITDADLPQAGRALDLLEYAWDAGVFAAMVGQGLGPMRNPGLRRRAGQVCVKLPLIALRERRRGPGLLDSLGVPSSVVTVTGDDAIELAVDARKDQLGNAIGVCLRVAGYSPVSAGAQSAVGVAVRAAATEKSVPLIPLIIAETPGSPDRATTVPLVRDSKHAERPVGRFIRASEVAEQVARCRVLVTGAYHLAVFALSQGIPVVGLTSTEYYDDKFLGLDDMFKGGVRLIHLNDPELAQRLPLAIREAWDEAEVLRDGLRARADEQAAASRQAFERLFELVEQRHAEHA